MKLSENFSLEEFTRSDTATKRKIDNSPSQVHLENLQTLVLHLLQPLRTLSGKSFKISSGYRSPSLNKAVGGASSSQHCNGQAVDFMISGLTAKETCEFVIKSGLLFDQLINEGTWCHLSYNVKGNRRQVLTAHFESGLPTTYTSGL